MFADPLLSQRIDEEKSNYSTFGRGRKAVYGPLLVCKLTGSWLSTYDCSRISGLLMQRRILDVGP